MLQNYTGTVVIVSHRRSFTADISKRYLCTSYDSIHGPIALSEHRRVIVQVESLTRLRGYQGCLLILDEFESLLSQTTSSVSYSQQGHKHLIELIRSAEHCIVMDGLLQQSSVELVQFIRKSRPLTIQNTTGPYQGHSIDIKPYTPLQKSNVIDVVVDRLNKGEKIVCMITSQTLANELHKAVVDTGKQCKLYTGEDLRRDEDGISMRERKEEDLKDIDQSWTTDCLIYTSTITAGVNYDKQHFDRFIGVYVQGTCDAIAFVQGLFRVRQFNHREHILWIQDHSIGGAQSPQQLVYRDDQQLYDTNVYEQFLLWSRSRSTALEAYRTEIVIKSLNEMGFTLSYKPMVEGIRLQSQPMLFMSSVVTQSDIDQYDALKVNRDLIRTCSITLEQGKKIAVMRSLGLDPTQTLSVSEGRYIAKHCGSIKTAVHIHRLTSGAVDTFDQVIDCDAQARVFSTSVKGVDRTRLTQLIEPLALYNRYKDLIDRETFTTEDLD